MRLSINLMGLHTAESHVDRSITDPLAFVKTNVIGINLLNAAKTIWKEYEGNDFITSVPMRCMEVWVRRIVYRRALNSPYSASKAVQISACLGGCRDGCALWTPFFSENACLLIILFKITPVCGWEIYA
jgi:hypothetical protein